jgi:hypothetical protein
VTSAGRSALFALTGIHSLIYWLVVHPTPGVTPAQTWPNVLWFSALLLSLGGAVFAFARMLPGEAIRRWATVALVAISVASLFNVIEDGFRVEIAFLFFILSGLAFDIALLALAIAIARTTQDRYRLLAVIPTGTLVAILFFSSAGGPILLITWIIAAAAAVLAPLSQHEARAASSSS